MNDREEAGTDGPVDQVSLFDAPAPDAAGHAPLPFPTVAIGASAGGVQALLKLFESMPADTGCAFIVALHMSPGHESHLAGLIGQRTPMSVIDGVDGVPLEPDRVFVVPPGRYAEVSGGRLALHPILLRPPRPVTIDRLMESLAVDQRERAIGVVLTGTDGDGTLGIKAIKGEGGMTIAQHPETAAYGQMPANAIATGLVDRQVDLDDVGATIVELVRHAGDMAARPPDHDWLRGLLEIVAAQTGFDFGDYKAPMLLRRIRRRMTLAGVTEPEAFRSLLVADPAEVEALAADFRISVTEFFREPEAWEALATDVIPALATARQQGSALRLWVPGCATGEEAYSLAMLLQENEAVAERRLQVQIFATDIDRGALEHARRGHYPSAIEKAVGSTRLRRHFEPFEDGYRIRSSLRELITFAPQNVISDPPFSRLDMISFRNVLIYMEPHLQRHVLQVFHFALAPNGILALGKSESVGSASSLFAVVSQRARIYRRVGIPESGRPGVPFPTPGFSRYPARSRPASRIETDYAPLVSDMVSGRPAEAAVLATRDGRVLHFHGPTYRFLQQPDGAPAPNLFAMAQDGLRPRLRALMHDALTTGRVTAGVAAVASEDGDEERVGLTIVPVAQPLEKLVLVCLKRLDRDARLVPPPAQAEALALSSLEDELRSTQTELHGVIEELEAANEELKVAHEESMSTNEELQSTNEELETSKEELQSVNDELLRVNRRLQDKVLELEALNDDLNNLFASTNIPTLFLDREFRIKRFTPAATRLFSLISSDAGRELTDIASRVEMAALVDDAREVLETLAPRESECPTVAGEWFLRRTLPYRTGADHIAGVVITFIDITALKRAGEQQRRYAGIMKGSADAIVVQGLDGSILAWNAGAEALYGYREADALQHDISLILPESVRHDHDREIAGLAAAGGRSVLETRRRSRNGTEIEVSSSFSLILDADDGRSVVALIERDIGGRKQAERALRDSERRFRDLADQAPVLIWLCDPQGMLTFVNRAYSDFVGMPAERLVGRGWRDLLESEDSAAAATAISGDAGAGTYFEARVRLRAASGRYSWMKCTARLGSDGDGNRRLIGSMVDIDDQVAAELALHSASQRKDEFLAMLGHELRNPLVPVRNAAEVLRRLADNDDRLTWIHDVLVRQVSHITRLVEDLLDISRITRGTLRMRVEPIDLGHVLRRAIDGVQPAFARKGHRFDADVPDDAVWVEGDDIRLIQVFENLLTNAAKYTDDGGDISVGFGIEGSQAVVRVRDSGIGVPLSMQSRIFDLFVQDQRATDRSHGGLGVGLALAHRLVELHGGSITVRSDGPGAGSEFIVRLPLITAARRERPVAQASATASVSGRILIVDDDPDAAETLAAVLRIYDYEARVAGDLESALAQARHFQPAVVLMDIALPGADGFEVMRRLRALPEIDPGVAGITMSGFGAVEDIERSRAEGFVRHLVKPVEPGELDALLRSILSQAN